MKKEDFVSLGISEELAVKAAESSLKELEGFISKGEYEAVNQAKAQLEKDIKDRDEQLENIKKSTGDNEALQKTITDLQAENQAAKDKYEADMRELQLSAAVKLAVAGSVHDVDIVSGLIDKTKLILNEGGKVTGLEDQVKALRETKGFLFKESPGTDSNNGAGQTGGYKPKAGRTNEGGIAKSIADSLNRSNQPIENPYAKAWD